jgi:DDE superfamily endonuclease
MFAALDLASGQLFYRFRNRKRWPEFLGFLRQLRTRFPTGRLFVVCDNFSPHRKTEVGDWCTVHDVELVFTPTHASWLNWIEAEFTAATTPPTPRKRPRSPATSAGPTSTPHPSNASPSAPRSADPITYPTLPDAALVSILRDLGGSVASSLTGQASGVEEGPRSYRLRQFGECGGQAELRRDLGGEFVVAAAQVLHEGVAGGDPGGRQYRHRPATLT